MEKDWVIVYTVSKQYRAEIIKEKLEENNIPSVIMNQRDSTFTSFGRIEIYVHESNAEKSKELLKDFED